MRPVLPLLLAVCLALAGCSAPVADSSPSVGSAALDGVTANDTLDERHAAALDAAGNFSYEGNLSTSERTERLDAAVQTDPSVSLTRLSARGVETTQFSNESGTYIRAEQSGMVAYDYKGAQSNVAGFTVAVVPFNATYERVGEGTVDGVPVAQFESDEAGENVTLGGYARLGVENFSATLSVTEDGLVKRVTWQADTPAGTFTYNGTYDAVGETTVETPAWVSDVETGNGSS